jgi:hypothetical protein
MLQTRITVRTGGGDVTVSGEEMIDVLRSLYVRDAHALDGSELRLTKGACEVRNAARDDQSGENSREKWMEAARLMGDNGMDLAPQCGN